MGKFIIATVCAAWIASHSFPTNPALSGMPENTFKKLQTGGNCGTKYIDTKVLSFSGSVYDLHRHKILTFGGGHATADFPNGVVEFDFSALSWNYVIPNFDCNTVYTPQNALFNSKGRALGGFRLNGQTYAGSRHTYDGLVMASDTALMISFQAQEFIGCIGLDEPMYRANYQGGSGLFVFDPGSKTWSVGDSTGLASSYSMAAVNPNEPDWVYGGSSGYDALFYRVNWKTGRKELLQSRPGGAVKVDHSMTYYPERNSFFVFPDNLIFEYNISQNSWKQVTPSGTAPNCYALNVVYDTLNKVFATFNNGQFYYYSPVQNRWYTTSANLSMYRLFHNHVYDPVDNVHVMIGDNDGSFWETYAYKFSDAPGKFPGTGLTVSVNRRPEFSPWPDIRVAPNPSRGGRVAFDFQAVEGTGSFLEIHDVSGRQVALIALSAGMRRAAWNSAGTPAGIYLAALRGGGKAIQKTVCIFN